MVIIFSLSSEFPINPSSTYFFKVSCTLFTDLIWSLILFSSSTHPQYGPLITGVHSRFSSALSGSAIRVNVGTLDPPPYAVFVYIRNWFMENPYSHYFHILPCVTESSWQIIILLLFPCLSLSNIWSVSWQPVSSRVLKRSLIKSSPMGWRYLKNFLVPAEHQHFIWQRINCYVN